MQIQLIRTFTGHGTGRANAMESFAESLQEQRPRIFVKVTEMRCVDLPHTTCRRLATMAREWKRQQRITERGGANVHEE